VYILKQQGKNVQGIRKNKKRIQDARREGTVIRSDRKTHFRSLLCIKKVTDKPSEYNYSETYTISDAADL
jgi:hypothetical protein